MQDKQSFLLVSEESKSFLAQACSQGLQIGKYPPIQVIVHFQNNSVVKTRLSVAPVFSWQYWAVERLEPLAAAISV